MQDPTDNRSCLKYAIALGTGASLYMALLIQDLPEMAGLFLPVHIIMGSIITVVLGGIALLLGKLLFWPPALRQAWFGSVAPSLLVLVVGITFVIFGEAMGFTTVLTDAETNETWTTGHPAASYGGMLAALFAVLHFPPGAPYKVRRLGDGRV